MNLPSEPLSSGIRGLVMFKSTKKKKEKIWETTDSRKRSIAGSRKRQKPRNSAVQRKIEIPASSHKRWKIAFQEQKVVHAVWIDLQKAFDKVWEDGSLIKLQRNEITNQMYSWIRSYLHNQRARVDVNDMEALECVA